MKRFFFIVFVHVILCLINSPCPAEEQEQYIQTSYSGSWTEKNQLENRAAAAIHKLMQFFTLKVLLTDERQVNHSETAAQAFQCGLYYPENGSRFLYASLQEKGLAARIKTPWARNLPYPETRERSIAELHADAPTDKENSLYAYVGTNQNRAIQAYSSAALFPDNRHMLQGGFGLGSNERLLVFLEGLGIQGKMNTQSDTSWFLESAALPSRTLTLYALSALIDSPLAAFSMDYALSHAFPQKDGLYANLGMHIGNSRWFISAALDLVHGSYTGPDTKEVPEGYRGGMRIRHTFLHDMYLQSENSIAGPAYGQPYETFQSILSTGNNNKIYDRLLYLQSVSASYKREWKEESGLAEQIQASVKMDGEYMQLVLGAKSDFNCPPLGPQEAENGIHRILLRSRLLTAYAVSAAVLNRIKVCKLQTKLTYTALLPEKTSLTIDITSSFALKNSEFGAEFSFNPDKNRHSYRLYWKTLGEYNPNSRQ